MTKTNATPAKLKNGTWGARVKTEIRMGDMLTITTKSGKSWDATVGCVVWHGDGVWLCTTITGGSRKGSFPDCSGSYCGYTCPVGGFRCSAKNGPCHDCV